jgi:hypothetical protein
VELDTLNLKVFPSMKIAIFSDEPTKDKKMN